MPGFQPIPYPGTFQRGTAFRSGDPLKTVWRHIERVGTLGTLKDVARRSKQDPRVARVANLRMRQALEYRVASQSGSLLTRPLNLYYAFLNLTRALLLVQTGDAGTRHGITFDGGGPALLDCAAKISAKGTFPLFAQTINLAGTPGTRVTLRQTLEMLPELRADYQDLGFGTSSVVVVRVQGLMRGDVFLNVDAKGLSAEDFAQNWSTWFPQLKDTCELTSSPHQLRHRSPPQDYEGVCDFFEKNLLHSLTRREDGRFFLFKEGSGTPFWPRALTYLASVFILSSVTRYEPERMAALAGALTSRSFLISSLLDNAERFYPHVLLELLWRTRVVFE
jgi:hypothetical protein